jgi:hypothetical protein
VFPIASGFAHDGFAIGTLEGDISDLSNEAPQEFIWVSADPGRHVYNAGEEGAVKLHDAKMAQDIRWSALQARQRASVTPSPANFTTPGQPRTPGVIPLTPSVNLSRVLQPQLHDPDTRIDVGTEHRLMQMFERSIAPYTTFDHMASNDIVASEERRSQLDRIESIRRTDIFSPWPDRRAIDTVLVSAKGKYATSITSQWSSTAGARDWATFMEMLYKLFYSTLYQPSLEAVKCLKMDSTEMLQVYSTRCAAAVRRYCQTIRKDPSYLPDELRLDILKWLFRL